MTEIRKLAAILAADVVGYSRLAGVDEDRILARLRALRSDLIDPTIAANRGRVVKRTGDGAIVEFRSVVDAVRCATEIQNAMIERNSSLADDERIVFRMGIHVGDVVEEADGDLMGDGVNIAARLESVAKPGAICLSEQAYWQVKGRLDFAVTDLGPTQLKNIAEPVRTYSLEVGVPSRAKPSAEAKRPKTKRRSAMAPLIAGVVALLLAVAGGAWYYLVASRPAAVVASAPPLAAAAPLSIVVLPFANLSGDPAQDYFADGVTDNLTTDLSRIRHSFVIAHNTALTYKGKAIDAKEIGKALDVRYVLEGSVQREGSRVRVNAQLIDAESGAHLWADRFEEDVADLFKLQDEVVARLGNSLGIELIKAEATRNAASKNPDATDFVMRAKVLSFQAIRSPSREGFEATIAMFGKALAIDPDDVDALSGQALFYLIGMGVSVLPYDRDVAAKALDEAERAIALAPNSLLAYHAKSFYLHFIERKNQEAIRVANEGLAINPNYAALYMSRQFAEQGLRQYEQAKSDLQQVLRLSPKDPGIGVTHERLGFAEFGLGHFDASAEEFGKALDAGWRPFTTYVGLAAAYAAQDKTLEAKAALEQARQVNPNVTTKYMLNHIDNIPGFFEALEKVGVPYE